MSQTRAPHGADDPTGSFCETIADDDPRLVAALAEYVAAVDAGQRPNRQEFLARHADIARQLASSLGALAFVHSAVDQVNHSRDEHAQPPAECFDSELGEGQPLGDYKIIREIGRGGMGVVYEAIQLSLGRRVALKVLSFAAALDNRHLQRFRNEAQAAAQLHHTNIVPVYAVGCERSVHFYAMQLIDGHSLAAVIEELRAARRGRDADDQNGSIDRAAARSSALAPATPARAGRMGLATSPTEGGADKSLYFATTTRGRLAVSSQPEGLSRLHSSKRSAYFRSIARLAMQAAEALDYAHRMGVVHRDIKPANILLDVQGDLWITDFGLAQFNADAGLTQTGDVLGTYRYMSPEQASGRAVVLDERTDIYSLGITLYELLTLERALSGQTREQLLYQISSVEPPKPRSIDRAIPQELETILLKAISKEPSARYASAREMADDLARFLRDEPILARPPSIWEQAVKWTRRHRSVAISALVILLLGAAGLLVSTLLIAHEQGNTKKAYVLEQRKAQEADQSFRQARDAVDFFTRIASQDMANRPEFVQLREQLLQASLLYYQNFLKEHKDDPSIGAELATARANVSNILDELATGDQLFRLIMRAGLLLQNSVRDDLQLTSDQRQNINQFINVPTWFTTFRSLQSLTPQQKRDGYLKKSAEIEANLNVLLTAQQRVRLGQIFLQARGADALSDADVAAALGLTREQKDRIKSIRNQAFRSLLDHFGPGGRQGPPPQHREPPPDRGDSSSDHPSFSDHHDGPDHHGPPPDHNPFAQGDRDRLQKVLAVLTPAQLARWNQMCGKPLQGPLWRDGGPFMGNHPH